METDLLIERIRERAALRSSASARDALERLLEALGGALDELAARAIGEALSPDLARHLRGSASPTIGSAAALIGAVAAPVRLDPGFAAEQTVVVCQELGRMMGEEAWALLRKHAPADVAALFERPDAAEPPLPPEAEPGRGTTLATGKPGSRHPVSESRSERAHQDSLARSNDPHAESRLSSSRGLTQERTDDTLAAGHPGSSRPLSGPPVPGGTTR